MKKVLWIAVFMTSILTTAIHGEVVYQSDFTRANLARTGLESVSRLGARWQLNSMEDRLVVNFEKANGGALVRTSNAWQSDGGFTLDVTFNQAAAGSRFTIGLVDVDWERGPRDWINERQFSGYGIGFVTDGELESAGTLDSVSTRDDFDVLGFHDGTSSSILSSAQGDVTFNTLQTLSITVTSNSYSYSLNGAPPATGSLTFDTSRGFRFVAYAQSATMQDSYISNITLRTVSTATTGKRVSIPEPTSFALIGGLLTFSAVVVRRCRR